MKKTKPIKKVKKPIKKIKIKKKIKKIKIDKKKMKISKIIVIICFIFLIIIFGFIIYEKKQNENKIIIIANKNCIDDCDLEIFEKKLINFDIKIKKYYENKKFSKKIVKETNASFYPIFIFTEKYIKENTDFEKTKKNFNIINIKKKNYYIMNENSSTNILGKYYLINGLKENKILEINNINNTEKYFKDIEKKFNYKHKLILINEKNISNENSKIIKKYKIKYFPTYIIKNQVLVGTQNYEIFEKILNQ